MSPEASLPSAHLVEYVSLTWDVPALQTPRAVEKRYMVVGFAANSRVHNSIIAWRHEDACHWSGQLGNRHSKRQWPYGSQRHITRLPTRIEIFVPSVSKKPGVQCCCLLFRQGTIREHPIHNPARALALHLACAATGQ